MTVDSGVINTEGITLPSDPPSSWRLEEDLPRQQKLTKDGTVDGRGKNRAVDGSNLAPEARLYRERVAAGLIHTVVSTRWGRHPRVECSCGEVFEEHNNEATGSEFNVHAHDANALVRRRSGPVTSSLEEAS